MKKKGTDILSYLAISFFMLYWISVFILAMPGGRAKEIIGYRAPLFKNNFGIAWSLFTPPGTSDDRLYFIVREISNHEKTDTLEILEDIAFQKQSHAPFNQQENILDHLVNNTVSWIKRTVWENKTKPSCSIPCSSDSLYIANAISAVSGNASFNAYLKTLFNYGRIVLPQKKITINGKELKILITEKQIKPFKQLDGDSFIPAENLVFETPYKSLVP